MESSWNSLVVETNCKVSCKHVNFRVVILAAVCCNSDLLQSSTTHVREQWFATVSNSRIGNPAVDFPRNDSLSVLRCTEQMQESHRLECYDVSTGVSRECNTSESWILSNTIVWDPQLMLELLLIVVRVNSWSGIYYNSVHCSSVLLFCLYLSVLLFCLYVYFPTTFWRSISYLIYNI